MRTISTLLTVLLPACADGGDKIDAEEFNSSFDYRFCEALAECDPDAVCALGTTTGIDLDACDFDAKAAEACLDGEWTCDDSDPDYPYVEKPAICGDVYRCDGTAL